MPVTPLPDEPSQIADERALLEGMLDYYRGIIVRKLEGLSETDARRTLGPSIMSPLGVVNHLVGVELWWYVEVLEGRSPAYPWTEDEHAADRDCDWRPGPQRTVASVLADHRAACDAARAAAALHDLDDVSGADRGRRVSLRWIHVHMIEELARHAGHLDLLREAIDGATGD